MERDISSDPHFERVIYIVVTLLHLRSLPQQDPRFDPIPIPVPLPLSQKECHREAEVTCLEIEPQIPLIKGLTRPARDPVFRRSKEEVTNSMH